MPTPPFVYCPLCQKIEVAEWDHALAESEPIRRFELAGDVEVTIHGDESRDELARLVVEHLDELSARSKKMLESFMRDSGEYELASIEVLAGKTTDGSDFSLRFTFRADRDPNEYGYTYFEVYFAHRKPPQDQFWPHKMTIGFM